MGCIIHCITEMVSSRSPAQRRPGRLKSFPHRGSLQNRANTSQCSAGNEGMYPINHPAGGFLFWECPGSFHFSFPTYRTSKKAELPREDGPQAPRPIPCKSLLPFQGSTGILTSGSGRAQEGRAASRGRQAKFVSSSFPPLLARRSARA